MNPDNLNLVIAFIAGLISFVSPCVLPLVPAYIGYMGGRVTNTVAAQVAAGAGGGQVLIQPTVKSRFTTVLHGLSFVGGFTFVFVAVGLAVTAFVRTIGSGNVQLVTSMIGRFGGILIIFFGLHFMGVLQPFFKRVLANQRLLQNPLLSPLAALVGAAFILWGFTGMLTPGLYETLVTVVGEESVLQWPTIVAVVALGAFVVWLLLSGAFTYPEAFWRRNITTLQNTLYTDTRRQMTAKGNQSFAGSAIMGVIFSAGWTPCIGPVYGSMLTLAANTGDVGRAGPLLIAYSLGLGVPFLLTALLLDGAQSILRRLQRQMRYIELVSGAFLVLIGFLVATNSLQTLSQSLSLNPDFVEISFNLEESVIGSLTGENVLPEDFNAEPTTQADASLGSITDAAAVSGRAYGTQVNDLAPDFEAMSESGERITLSDYQGQVVILNFWATWCGPCRIEMPEYEAAYQRYRDEGLVILAINNAEPREAVSDFRVELGLTFPLVLDPRGEIQEKYAVSQYPTTFVIDRSGVIITRHPGFLIEEQIQEMVADALAQ